MDEKLLKAAMPYIALGIVAYFVWRKMKVKLPAIGQETSSALITAMNKPSVVTNVASEETSAYTQAVDKIIAANPQYTPEHVKQLLVYFDWTLGQPMPPGSGLIAPEGM